jgi:hypothetical protein
MVLERHKVSRNRYSRWLTDEAFGAELSRRIAAAYLQSQALIAKYSLVAAAKLVQLTESAKEETARRACLDIISLPGLSAKKAELGEKSQDAAETAAQQFSDETASRLLEVLAEGKNKEQEEDKKR